jgi:hypothetical protein
MFASLLSAAPWLNKCLFSLLVLVLVLMGLQGIAYAPAAGLNHWLRLVCLPPDPGLSIPHRSCHCFCWLQLPLILCLGLLSSRYWHKSMDPPLRCSPQPGASQRGGMPHVHPSSVCFSLVLTLRLPTGSSCSSGSASLQYVLPSHAYSTFASGSQPLPSTTPWSFGTTEWVWPSMVAYTIQPAASVCSHPRILVFLHSTVGSGVLPSALQNV